MNAGKKRRTSAAVLFVLVTGFIAAALDAVAAMVVYSVEPAPLFRFIASGLLGPGAFNGGSKAAVIGALLHFAIALGWTAFMFAIYRRIAKRLAPGVIVFIFGAIIWMAMNLVVLPLSEVQRQAPTIMSTLTGISILIATVALPIVVSASYFFTPHSRVTPHQ